MKATVCDCDPGEMERPLLEESVVPSHELLGDGKWLQQPAPHRQRWPMDIATTASLRDAPRQPTITDQELRENVGFSEPSEKATTSTSSTRQATKGLASATAASSSSATAILSSSQPLEHQRKPVREQPRQQRPLSQKTLDRLARNRRAVLALHKHTTFPAFLQRCQQATVPAVHQRCHGQPDSLIVQGVPFKLRRLAFGAAALLALVLGVTAASYFVICRSASFWDAARSPFAAVWFTLWYAVIAIAAAGLNSTDPAAINAESKKSQESPFNGGDQWQRENRATVAFVLFAVLDCIRVVVVLIASIDRADSLVVTMVPDILLKSVVAIFATLGMETFGLPRWFVAFWACVTSIASCCALAVEEPQGFGGKKAAHDPAWYLATLIVPGVVVVLWIIRWCIFKRDRTPQTRAVDVNLSIVGTSNTATAAAAQTDSVRAPRMTPIQGQRGETYFEPGGLKQPIAHDLSGATLKLPDQCDQYPVPVFSQEAPDGIRYDFLAVAFLLGPDGATPGKELVCLDYDESGRAKFYKGPCSQQLWWSSHAATPFDWLGCGIDPTRIETVVYRVTTSNRSSSSTSPSPEDAPPPPPEGSILFVPDGDENDDDIEQQQRRHARRSD